MSPDDVSFLEDHVLVSGRFCRCNQHLTPQVVEFIRSSFSGERHFTVDQRSRHRGNVIGAEFAVELPPLCHCDEILPKSQIGEEALPSTFSVVSVGILVTGAEIADERQHVGAQLFQHLSSTVLGFFPLRRFEAKEQVLALFKVLHLRIQDIRDKGNVILGGCPQDPLVDVILDSLPAFTISGAGSVASHNVSCVLKS